MYFCRTAPRCIRARSVDAHERLDGLLDEARLTGRSHRRRAVVGQLFVRIAEAQRHRVVAGRTMIVVGRFVFVATAQRLVRRPVRVLVDVHLSAHGTLKPGNIMILHRFS